jgi:5-methylthioadenosine/S-adenosylhomocysteine deaminase
MATIDGARALGLDHEIGSLEVGKSADIVAFDLNGAGYSETPDPETLLVYSGSGRDLRHAWVAGEQLVRDREIVRRPFAEIRRDYSAAYRTFWDRVATDKKTNSKRDVA